MIVTFLTIWTLAAAIGTAVLVIAAHHAATLPVRSAALVGMVGSQVVIRRLDGTLSTIDLAEPAHTR